MKKILLILLCILMSASLTYGTVTKTTNLELVKPASEDLTVDWFDTMNDNMDLIDDIFDDVSLIEFNYLNGVTSAIQTQLNAKQALDAGLTSIAGLTTSANKSIYTTALDTYATYDLTAFARSILDDADAAAVRTTIGVGTGTVTTSGTPVANDIARFTGATVIEGLSYAEFKAALDLEIGTDILAQQTIGIADNNLLEVDGSPNANEYARFTASGLEGRTEAEFKADFNLEIGTDVLAQQTIGIANDNLVEMDDANAAVDDYCKLTANGIVGRSYTEVKTDLGIDLSLYYLKTAIDTQGEVEAIWGDALMNDLVDDTAPEYGGAMDHNNERDTEVATIEFNALYDNESSGATPTIDWQNGNYQKIAISENALLTFSNAFIGTITLVMTYGGNYTLGFNVGYTIHEEGGIEIVFSEASGEVDILKVMYLGSANNYVVGAMLDVKD